MSGELGGRGCPGCSGLGKPTGLLPAAVSWPHFGQNPWQASSVRHSCGCSPWHGCGARTHGAWLWGQPSTQPRVLSPTCSSGPIRVWPGTIRRRWGGPCPDPSSIGPRVAAILTCRNEIQQTLRRAHVQINSCLFVWMDYSSKVSMFPHCPQAMRFFCLDIITACVVVVRTFFSYVEKNKNSQKLLRCC